MNARTQRKSILPLVLVGAVAFATVAAVAFYVISGMKPHAPPQGRHGNAKPPVITQVPVPAMVTVYLPEASDGEAYLKPVEVRGKDGSKGSIEDLAVETLLSEGQGEAGQGIIPSGTRLITPVKVNGDTAIVNLSKEFIDNFPGGSTQEALTLNSIAYTVVNNSGGEVKRVKILVEGETVETLGGHLALDEPFEPDPQVLKLGTAS